MKSRILSVVGILLMSGLGIVLPGKNMGQASDFPSRPLEVIINFAPGGTLDLAVRIMGNDLPNPWGSPSS